MKCPRCGYPRVKYKQQAGHKKSPKEKHWERTDHTAKCSRCGFVFNAETRQEIIEKKLIHPNPKTKDEEKEFTMADDRENMTNEELEEVETQIEQEFKIKNPNVACGLYNITTRNET